MSTVAYWRRKDIRYWGGSVGSPQTEPCVDFSAHHQNAYERISEDELDNRIRSQYSEYFQDNPHDEIVEPEPRTERILEENKRWACHLSKGGGLRARNFKPKGKQRTVFIETHHH